LNYLYWILLAGFGYLAFNEQVIFVQNMIYKSTLLFYSAGIAIGAGIGLAINNLAIGMGVGAALGLIFARRYRNSLHKNK